MLEGADKILGEMVVRVGSYFGQVMSVNPVIDRDRAQPIEQIQQCSSRSSICVEVESGGSKCSLTHPSDIRLPLLFFCLLLPVHIGDGRTLDLTCVWYERQ